MKTYNRYATVFSIVLFIVVVVFLQTLSFLEKSNKQVKDGLTFLHEISSNFSLIAPTKPISRQRDDGKKSCIIDDWMRFDPSVATLPRHIFCDELSKSSDILCRWFLTQNNITDHSPCRLPKDGYKVPNIVFYVTFTEYKFLVEHYLCILSAKKIQKPQFIYIVGDVMPTGLYWEKLLKDVPELRIIYRQKPEYISRQFARWPAHLSDIVRVQILLANGGIYMDTDEIFIQSFNPLRNYNITMGLVDVNTGMGNAVIVAERRSPFLQKMYDNYKHFNNSNYYANSLKTAYYLWKNDTSSLHLESENFYRPGWWQDDLLFVKTGFKWRTKYAVHVWSKRDQHRMPKTLDVIDNWNTTLGEIFRYIYYGVSRLRKNRV
ncbi:hypothetical protein LOTGIDRAFT_238614 [Lottia gigantea]|uniref:Alpha-1,4-N-acetylglucosaminyltransferase n=1 Tax=Lottia gigantea TaxID=225164 RepID=V4B1S5_LOTGI|nr:hypothetical protein LOTGIDRAFT_238614 [Lottia gigantea]ESP00277.1 hypothetical protein LOTGIDRAFT_238614 [Lottia gigantea]